MSFDIDTFAANCEAAMAENPHRKQEVAAEMLRELLANESAQDIIDTLEAAVPPGASIGELVVHRSSALTMLYARLPPRFQSAVHNHTIFACIGALRGREKNTVFEPLPDGGLRVLREVSVSPGEVLALPAEAVHNVENPATEIAASLHLYGGDLPGVAEERALWSAAQKRKEFSFPELLRESLGTMKASGNDAGVEAVIEAMPAARRML
jgi:predicted metal-dependent enzyme (double-stranded beta helix superfamily)